jgi:hypothetical protein
MKTLFSQASRLAGRVRHVVLRLNHEKHLRALVCPQLAVFGAGVGMEKISGTETAA